MNVWRKQSVKYYLGIKRVSKGTPKAKRKTIVSKRFYGTLRLASGKPKQIPLTEERETSQTLLRRLQTEEDSKRANGADRYYDSRRKPLTDFLTEYETYLTSKGNTAYYVSQAGSRIRKLLAATKATTIDDLDVQRIANTLADWRKRKEKPFGTATTNHYARAIKGFSRWLWLERKTSDNPLIGLRLLNADTDRKRERRALTDDELSRLLLATTESKRRRFGLTANDRAMLYRVASYTGLRASELASLTKSSFDLVAGTVTVSATYSKRRKNDVLPLHSSLLGCLPEWLDGKGNGKLWVGTWNNRNGTKTARMLRHDLKRAAIPYRDESGRVADFHSLRHTFITSLAKAGVHPSKAQRLARHSTINLTMNVYTSLEIDDLRSALDTVK